MSSRIVFAPEAADHLAALYRGIASDIAKYLGKGGDATTFNKKRYWTSRGVALPETTTYAHLGPKFSAKDAVAGAHQCVLEHGTACDGLRSTGTRG